MCSEQSTAGQFSEICATFVRTRPRQRIFHSPGSLSARRSRRAPRRRPVRRFFNKWAERFATLRKVLKLPWRDVLAFLDRLRHIPETDEGFRRWFARQLISLDHIAAATGTEFDDLLLDVLQHQVKDDEAWELLWQAIEAARGK